MGVILAKFSLPLISLILISLLLFCILTLKWHTGFLHDRRKFLYLSWRRKLYLKRLLYPLFQRSNNYVALNTISENTLLNLCGIFKVTMHMKFVTNVSGLDMRNCIERKQAISLCQVTRLFKTPSVVLPQLNCSKIFHIFSSETPPSEVHLCSRKFEVVETFPCRNARRRKEDT